MSFKKSVNIAGWVVFALSFVVYILSAERSGSLWDCGEFIAGAYKLQVVHPPGAPFFILVGRLFTYVAELISDDPSDIAFAVNLMSGMCTAFMAMFVTWIAMLLGKMTLVGRAALDNKAQLMALVFAGLTAGFTSAFASSIWFSAVEGEVYAMSTFFTALVTWLIVKWYHLPKDVSNERYLVLAIYFMGLSIGVHLLSLLTLPVLFLFYYLKKRENPTWKGMLIYGFAGVVMIGIIQKFIIAGVPFVWAKLELLMVNTFGLPVNSGVIPLIIIFAGASAIGLYYAHKIQSLKLQNLMMALSLIVISYMSFGVVVVRANANTPINMNEPSDAFRILPYLNREQYGERPLLYGPNYEARPYKTETEERYGLVGDEYEIVDRKVTPLYRDKDKMLFPRLGHNTLNRPTLYKMWLDKRQGEEPTGMDNLYFFFRYQIDFMYVRYFFWNFVGRQNGAQGYYDWDSSSGNWMSGIKFIDEWHLHNLDEEPEFMKNAQGRNHYYFIPLLFGILGMIYHYKKRKNDFLGLLSLFIITGLGIIVYSNQPPSEPRERDYVLAASFFTFAIWVGMGALYIFEQLKNRIGNAQTASFICGITLLAPILMLSENFDDHSRRHLSGAVDYANNFLESCDENAIIFTYGDNDTYPLWYAQEVEGIRTDVRVVNLSLLQVDWYINQLRRKVNDSPPIKMSISPEAIRGYRRNQIPIVPKDQYIPLDKAVQFVGEDHPTPLAQGVEVESVFPSRRMFIPIDKQEVIRKGIVDIADTARLVDRINIQLEGSSKLKDEITILDIIANNFPDRPIYWAVTVRENKLMGLGDFLEMEGLALKLTPLKKTRKDGFENYSIYGKGTMDAEKTLQVVREKWKWGGFDQYNLFVDDSFGPSVQSMRMVITRAAENFLINEEYEKAREIINIYFDAFPNMNFPYDQGTVPLIMNLFDANGKEEGKEHLKVLAENASEYIEFLNSLSPEEIANSYSTENDIYAKRMKQQLPAIAAKYVGEDFAKEIEAIINS
ncbi:MAG TPA: DUF2723 domain-containing protein [Saprospiraceae bacterium]|nr:DUF2723 domain-containing protein [Saprospiraceae bacterium]